MAVFLAGPSQAAVLAVTHARIYTAPDRPAIADGTILIQDGRIAIVGPSGTLRIPAGAARINVHGRSVAAGFWNSHVHLMSRELLHADQRSDAELSGALTQMLTRWGFTTVFDTASLLSNTDLIRQRIARGEVQGPLILTVGDPFYPKDGTPIYVRQFLKDNGFPDEEITNLPDALARADRQLNGGADGIKLFTGAIVGGEVGVLPMPLEQARALAARAHVQGKPVFAHPSNLDGLMVAMESGVDVLAHTTPMTGPWPLELTGRILAHHMALVPTLTLFESEAKKFGESAEDSNNDINAAVQQVRAFSQGGGQILFGTDVGYTDVFDTTEEYRLLSRALSWRQILTALTIAPAQRFGFRSTKGRVEAGMDADLVVLDGDPAKDITAFARVKMTLRYGQTVYKSGH
jgi:imidazolonepropionase-like amidohydrolase